ncbi:MAG: WcbI family polysaccharide biosynthesis putative acetyltransferase [Bacillota bacterium]
MKKCMVFGNCQISLITRYLLLSKTFSSYYQIIDVPPVFLCDQKGLNRDDVKKCNLFIYQKIGDAFGKNLSTDYLLNCLPDTCQTISFTNTYFTGYHPEYVHNEVHRPDPRYNPLPNGKFPYGDKNIINLLKEGKSKNEIAEILWDDNFYSYEEVKANLDMTLDDLNKREEDLDVKAADFIRKNYRENRLFYTINHPTYLVTRHVAMGILRKMGLPEWEISAIVDDPFKGHLHVPYYPSVIKHLQLSFIDKNHRYSLYYDLDKTLVTFKEYIYKYVDYVTGV